MSAKLTLAAMTALLIAAGSISAQQPSEAEQVEALVRQSFDASSRGDWTAYVGFLHTEATDKFKGILMPVFEVAAFQDTSFAQLGSQYFGLEMDSGQIVDKPAPEFMGLFMDSVMNLVPTMKESMSKSTYDVIGTVFEGDSLAHVVYRVATDFEGSQFASVDLSTLRSTPDGWKMLLSGQLKGLADRIAQLVQTGR